MMSLICVPCCYNAATLHTHETSVIANHSGHLQRARSHGACYVWWKPHRWHLSHHRWTRTGELFFSQKESTQAMIPLIILFIFI